MIPTTEVEKLKCNIINSNDTLSNDKAELIAKIKKLLPNIVNSDNIVNTNNLNELFDITNTTSNNQGYELTFAGKGIAKAKKDTPPTKELKAELNQSKNFNETENVIIRGDNLDVLKILKQNYNEKIKMIYIDPPYNTKNDEFVYSDNFKELDKNLIEKFGLNENTINYLTDLYGTHNHSGWLSFMYPRLLLARDLLTDDGVIFISIDDREQANLKIMCDEIFGEENFVSCLIWQDKYTTTNDKNGISSQTDYILCYCRNLNNISINKLPLRDEYIKTTYTNDDNNDRGKYRLVQMYKKKNPYSYDVTSPSGKVWNMPWNFTRENFLEMDKNNKIYWGKDNNAQPQKKVYLKDSDGVNPVNLLLGKDVGFSGDGGNEIEELFNDRNIFSYPKNTKLIKHILKISSNPNDLILDFFAGSGTTANAVIDLNKEENSNRKFILVQWDEKINEDKSKTSYDFCKNELNSQTPVISDITIERVNRAGDRLNSDLLTDQNLDIGYKVFSLVDKPKIDYKETQFELFNIREKTIDILYNMLSANCLQLTEKIEEIEKDKIYLIDNCYYILDNCNLDGLEKHRKIYIDGYSNISLENWLNMNTEIDNNDIGVVY